jgi:hypothetical protein
MLEQKYFRTKICYNKISYKRICWNKNMSEQKYVRTKISYKRICWNRNMSEQKYVRTKISYKRICWNRNMVDKSLFEQKFFLTNVAALVFCLVHGTHDNKTRFYFNTAFLKINQGPSPKGNAQYR